MQSTLLPVVAIVGRPNVGKSTLFNCLTNTRNALVGDMPGLTRDRQYGQTEYTGRHFLVVDTGGLTTEKETLATMMAEQTQRAIAEADVILFLVDGRSGVTHDDQLLAKQLRKLGKPIILTVNKAEGQDSQIITSEFHRLGLGEPQAISAAHRQHISSLLDQVLIQLPELDTADEVTDIAGIKVAIVGRPNAGKSTLVNRMLGEERVLVYDAPGTTRDSVFIPLQRRDKNYVLIDTAGVRRRARVHETIEKFSVIKSLQTIEAAQVVLFVIDGKAGISDQDLHLLGFVVDAGKALVIAINKWDGLSADQRERIKTELDRRLPFASFAKQHFISALHGTGVGNLFASINQAYHAAHKKLTTSRLTQILETAIAAHQPPLVSGRRIKLRYAHAGGHNPPVIVIHGTQAKKLPASYQRYLMNYYRDVLRLQGTPIRIEMREGVNPFDPDKPAG